MEVSRCYNDRYIRGGFTTGGNVVVFAVGAVYDRATFASERAKCAVIDRAYSGKWVANSYVVPQSQEAEKKELPRERGPRGALGDQVAKADGNVAGKVGH